jgi:KTSC domain
VLRDKGKKAPNMERVPVSSSSIATVGYDTESKVLEVEYQNGGIYQYAGVPPELHNQLMNSPSLGAFMNQQIRKLYSFSKVG